MPFSLDKAPSTFQSLMNQKFKPSLRKFVLVFFDNILVYSSDVEKLACHLFRVFHLLLQNSLYVKLRKCKFVVSSIEYPGHLISSEDVATDTDKVKANFNWQCLQPLSN